MEMPYQRLARAGNILFAARGSHIDSFSLEDGALLSTWTCPTPESPKSESVSKLGSQSSSKVQDPKSESLPAAEEVNEESSPPAKRRKLFDAGQNGSKAEQQNGKKQKKQNARSDAVASGLEAPAVVVLVATKDGRHVVAVTGEDKSIRVFENNQVLSESGEKGLKQISLRPMPKRPCSLKITSDDSTIISADKFGDVYSLPLIQTDSSTKAPSQSQTPEPSKPFLPAANELTIHSKRNLKALENQRRQTNQAPEKSSDPTFECKLLLGHVSMLTDVLLASLNGREYILTADRDEHIRVSRGSPQTHVIESFCLGHEEFVTRLCVPDGREDVLISGGGDDDLFVWDWIAGRLVSRFNVKSLVKEVSGEEKGDVKLVVSGIHHLKRGDNDLIFVTFEGVPALLILTLAGENTLSSKQVLPLPGNVLDLIISSTSNRTDSTHDQVIISVDLAHKPGSTSELREKEKSGTSSSLLSFEFQGDALVHREGLKFATVEGGDSIAGNVKLGGMLYNLEALRKREDDGGAKDD